MLPAAMRAVLAEGGRCALAPALALPTPRAHELLIRVAWSAINRADTLQRLGKYAVPAGASPVLGLEAAGVVAALGADVGAHAGAPRLGDRVMALLSGGGNAEFVTCDWRHAMPVPPNMTLRTAAAVPETFLTAFQLLHLVGGARAGETVLVHAAGSGVGTAAVQLAAAHRLRVVAVAGADAKLAKARALGAAAAVNYKTSADWPAEALAAAAPGGADLVLDPVGASMWEGNARVLALDGRWVLYGSLGGVAVDGPLFARLMQKRAQLLATTLRSRSDDYKADLVARFAAAALPALASGALAPVLDAEFELADAQLAHERMESDVGCGKILLRVSGQL
jgi:tumor protein p53-inducible protein 3